MGFFIDDAQLAAIEKQARAKTVKKSNLDLNAKGCDFCTLKEYWPVLTSPRIPITGNINGDILIVAEAPGEEEDKEGEVLVGKSGRFLRQHIPMRHLERIGFTNAARCRPPNNRTPTFQEMHCCSVFLEEDINKYNFKYILGMGAAPFMKFITEAPISNMIGIKFPVQIGQKILWYYPTFHPSFILKNGEEKALQYPAFKASVKNFFKEFDKWPKPKIYEAPEVIGVFDKQQAYALYNKLGPIIGYDIETLGLYPYQNGNTLLTAAFSDGNITFAFPVNHPECKTDWGLDLILKATREKQWVAHSSGFELSWTYFNDNNKNPNYNMEDSMAVARVLFNRESIASLAIVSRILLGINIKKETEVNASNIMSYSLSEVLPYNGFDAWACLKCWEEGRPRIDDYNYNHFVEAERSTTIMQILGLPININTSREFKDKWSQKSEECVKHARTLYEAKAYERKYQKELSIGSPDQVGTCLVEFGKIALPRTKNEKKVSYVTDDEILSKHKDNPLVVDILNFREARKIESTYIDPIIEAQQIYFDKQIHPCYTTMFTATARLSSNNPNIQNFPKKRNKEIRNQIEAPPGHILLSCDEGQLEARIYAMATKDPVFCQSIIDKEDIHTYWLNKSLEIYPDYMNRLREKLDDTDEKKILRHGRDIIKGDFVFASLFGTTAGNCAERTGIPFILIKDLLDVFWQRYAIAYKWLKNQKKLYDDTSEIKTLTNRIRFGILGGMEPINTPIQASAADLVIDAQNELSKLSFEMKDPYLHPRINVHDDLTFIIPDKDEAIEYYLTKYIAPAMTRVRFPWQIVPLAVEAKIGKCWADMEEIAVITGDYVR